VTESICVKEDVCVCVCVCVCVRMCVCMCWRRDAAARTLGKCRERQRTCVHVYIQVYTRICTQVYIYSRMCVHVCIQVCTCIYTCVRNVRAECVCRDDESK